MLSRGRTAQVYSLAIVCYQDATIDIQIRWHCQTGFYADDFSASSSLR